MHRLPVLVYFQKPWSVFTYITGILECAYPQVLEESHTGTAILLQ